MTMNNDDDSAELLARLSRLPDERLPEPGVEERTIRSLHARGVLRRSRAYGWAYAAVAATVMFALGLGLGYLFGLQQTGTDPTPNGRARGVASFVNDTLPVVAPPASSRTRNIVWF